LDHRELADSSGERGIPTNRHPRDSWSDLLEQLHPFPGQGIIKQNKASCVATWSRQAVDEATTDRIDGTDKHDQ
jgi:hypothetical protein